MRDVGPFLAAFALGVTFPLNVTIGIPIYYAVTKAVAKAIAG